MTAEEQEYLSRRYVYSPLLFLRLSSGRIAVGEGLGARDLLTITSLNEELLQLIHARAAGSVPLDLSSLDLGDFLP